jgi:hypothetical protein
LILAFGSFGTLLIAEESMVRMDLRLMGADLLDEMVYDWKKSVPFPGPRPMALAEVVAPLGLDDRFQILIENRLMELIALNPDLSLQLVRCSACSRLVAKSTPQGTWISRGIDQPEVLQDLITSDRQLVGLGLYFEAAGRELWLRAQIFELDGNQKILWARSYSTSMSARRVLREASPLISLEAARQQQEQILRGRDQIEFSGRGVIRMFNTNPSAIVTAAPIPFVEASLEGSPRSMKQTRLGFTLGFSSVADSMSAWTVGGHYATLLFRREPSLINPDLYFFFGMHYLRMRGPGAVPFGIDQPDLFTLQGIRKEPRASLTAWRIGLEAHIKYRLGMLAFVENLPGLDDNQAFAKKNLLFIPYHSWGWGMVFRW